MLRAVFIGSDNWFNRLLVNWLAARVELAGVVWVQATAWQETWGGRWRFARERVRRYGIVKVCDEALFFLYYHAFLEQRDSAELRAWVHQPGRRDLVLDPWQGEALSAEDVNSREVRDFLRRCRPDVTFAMYINNYFKKAARTAARHGTFLWHEGITPEYKGLYSPFWAIHNLDFDNVGYTLLRMSAKLDAGEIFVQGPARDIDPFRHLHLYVGHKAIWDSLPAVGRFLEELEAGTARPIERQGAKSGYYTYPGFSDWLRQRWRLRRLARRGQPRS